MGRLAAASVVVVLALVALTGCGGSKPAYCSDKADFQQSVSQLKGLSLSSDGISAVQKQFDDVQSSANKLVASLKSAYGAQADALKSALGGLGNAVKTAAAQPSGANVSAVVTNLGTVQTAWKNLEQSLSTKCK